MSRMERGWGSIGKEEEIRSVQPLCFLLSRNNSDLHPSFHQLFARSGALPSSSTTRPQSHFNLPLTSFTMDLRTPSPLPASPLELARFLTTSLTFMNTLERAELFVDDRRLVLVEKETGTMKKVGVPANLERRSEGGLMYVEGLESTGQSHHSLLSVSLTVILRSWNSTQPLVLPWQTSA